MTPTIVFLGESPPAGSGPHFVPFDCGSGTRLAATLGLRGRHVVTSKLKPLNLFDTPRGVKGTPAWDAGEAHRSALRIGIAAGLGSVAVCLGARVLEACSATPRWPHLLSIPHPSGASTALNTAAQKRDARRVVLPALVALGPLSASDFDLARPEVVVDLATALCPDEPERAVAVLEHLQAHASKEHLAWRSRLVDLRIAIADWKLSQRALADAARLLRNSPWDPDEADDGTGRPKSGHVLGADRVYRHWCHSELWACARLVREAQELSRVAESERLLQAGSQAGVV